MPDNKKIRQPEDNKRIDIHDPKEVRNWCDALGCIEDKLVKAVQAVGTSAEEVRKWLNEN